MKILIQSIIAVLFSISAFAEVYCPDYDYKENGWVIHNPSEFEKILNDIHEMTVNGVMNSTMVEDVDAFMLTNNSSIAPELFMKVNTWDVLATSQDLMYGDIAIFTDLLSPENALEVRWFDGKQKHIVYNERYMYCISIVQPATPNTIF